MGKPRSAPFTLPRTLRVFVNHSGAEPFFQISETPEDAYVDSGGDVVIGVYELKEKVRLKFKVEELPA